MPNYFDQFDAPGGAGQPAAPFGPPAASGNFFDQFDPPQPSVAADVARSIPAGLAKGTAGLLGLPGDVRHFTDWALEKAFGPPPALSRPLAESGNPFGTPAPSHDTFLSPLVRKMDEPIFPDSATVRRGMESVVGPLYEPQTRAGRYVQNVAEFAPAALAGPETLLPRLIKQAAVPGIASEALGEATEGTALEPWARLAGGIGGSMAASALDAATAARQTAKAVPKPVTPTIAQTKAAASAGYQDPAVKAVTFQPSAISAVADNAINDLKASKLNARLAPQTHALLDDLRNPINGAAHTIEDFETTRQLLSQIAGKFTDPVEQMAASKAIKFLDTYRSNVPAAHVLTGDAAAADKIIQQARGNYAAAATADRVQQKINNAQLQAASTHSGGNLNNAMRQKLRPLLISKPQGRGLTQDELDLIEQAVTGSPTGNALRATGKLLGGGGGLGALHTGLGGAAIGAGTAGLPGLAAGIALPALGFGIKKLGDALTNRSANKVVSQILQRSPLAWQQSSAAAAARAALPTKPTLEFWKRLLLSSGPGSLQLRQQAGGAN